METSRRWYRLRLSNFLVLNSKYRNQPEANCAALQLIPDKRWLLLFPFGEVKFTCREYPVELKPLLSGQECNLCLTHTTKSFNGYVNSPLPSWHKQGRVSNNTNICSFKWTLWEIEASFFLFCFVFF